MKDFAHQGVRSAALKSCRQQAMNQKTTPPRKPTNMNFNASINVVLTV